MIKLFDEDFTKIVNKLPKELINLITAGKVFLAGGFIRSIISNEEVRDVDLFGKSYDDVINAKKLLVGAKGDEIVTDNAITLPNYKYPIQFIIKYFSATPEELISAFDYTICQAVIFYNNGEWNSLISDRFYADLAAKRLIYTKPKDNNVGGSINRMIRFVKKGYNISRKQLSELISDFIISNEFTNITDDALLKKVKNKINTDDIS